MPNNNPNQSHPVHSSASAAEPWTVTRTYDNPRSPEELIRILIRRHLALSGKIHSQDKRTEKTTP